MRARLRVNVSKVLSPRQQGDAKPLLIPYAALLIMAGSCSAWHFRALIEALRSISACSPSITKHYRTGIGYATTVRRSRAAERCILHFAIFLPVVFRPDLCCPSASRPALACLPVSAPSAQMILGLSSRARQISCCLPAKSVVKHKVLTIVHDHGSAAIVGEQFGQETAYPEPRRGRQSACGLQFACRI